MLATHWAALPTQHPTPPWYCCSVLVQANLPYPSLELNYCCFSSHCLLNSPLSIASESCVSTLRCGQPYPPNTQTKILLSVLLFVCASCLIHSPFSIASNACVSTLRWGQRWPAQHPEPMYVLRTVGTHCNSHSPLSIACEACISTLKWGQRWATQRFKPTFSVPKRTSALY